MSVLVFSHLPRPENLHEIAWLRLIEVVEVLPKPELVKKTGCARSVCVPSAPDTFAVALISNDQSLQRGIIQCSCPCARKASIVLIKTRYVAPEQKLGEACEGKMKNLPDSKCAED